VPEGKLKVDLSLVQDRELEIIGSLMYTRDDFTEALDLIQKRKIEVSSLVTHYFKLEDIQKAFFLITERKEKILKVLINLAP